MVNTSMRENSRSNPRKIMSKPQIYLFVQEGCRLRHYVQAQLSKVHNWENPITVTDSKCCGEWSDFAKASGVVATPTLVAIEAGEVVARQAGSQSFTAEFFEGLIAKFS